MSGESDIPETDGGVSIDDDHLIPVPKYESEQYLPRGEDIRGTRKELLLDEFGYIRTYFKTRPEKHFQLQRKLNQARMGTTYDVYLTRSVWYSIPVGIFGALLGLAFAWLLVELGTFEEMSAPELLLNIPGMRDLSIWLSPYVTQLGSAIIVLVGFTIFAASMWFYRYYRPSMLVDSRRRNINITLPHVIVFMYALSFGGMSFTEIIKRTSETEDTYGQVANEFDMIVKDTELFGNDLYTGIRNARNLTPSENMEQFLDDMLSVLDSGGNFTEFLRAESEKYMDEAVREQESFLDTLELLSEIFIIGFVAGPLFFVVTLLMMSFLGGETLPLLFLLVYALIPLGMAGYLVLISTLSDPYKQPVHELDDLNEDEAIEWSEELEENPGYELFQGLQLRRRVRRIFRDPVAVFKGKPLYSLIFSVPAALIVWVYFWFTMDVALNDFLMTPYSTGIAFIILPFLIVSIPLAGFYEHDRRRRRHVAKRLPDTLDILGSANQMGVSFVDGLEIVSRNITGSFAQELENTRNDIKWNVDLRDALISLGHRVKVPQLIRTCHILAEGSRSSGELYRIMSIAAEDTRQRYRLERNQRQELQAYTTVVIIGFLVYMGVIVVIDYSFLGMLTEQIADQETADAGQDFLAIDLDELAIYQALFFHSALIMAVGTGLISGKLTSNEILSGLKYAIGLVLVTVLVFALI